MKTAVLQSEPGRVVQTTRVERPLTPENASSSRSTPEIWEYLAALGSKASEEWDRHLIYIYRTDPQPSVPVEKCSQFMTAADGSRVSMADKEEVEFALARKYGGKVFRLIVKRGSERICEGRVYVDAPPRPVVAMADTPNASSVTVTPMSDATATATVAGQAMQALTSQERQSAEIGFQAMRTAADVMQRFSSGNGNGSSDTAVLVSLVRDMIAEMRSQSRGGVGGMSFQEIIAAVGTGIALLKDLGVVGQSSNPLFTKIMDTGLQRLLEPAANSGQPAVSATAELVRQLPTIAVQASNAIGEWRRGMEAQRDTVSMMQQPGAHPGVAQPSVLPPGLPATAPNPQPAGETMQIPSPEFLESKIIEILKEPVGAEQAADDVLHFLSVINLGLVAQLASQGKTGLLQLFQTRPMLKPATQNMPRLIEFIDAFLRLHAEDQGGASELPKPN